jgi:excisionase family DNA binding protein
MQKTGTVRETAQKIEVSEKTVRRWIKEGILEAELVPGKTGKEYRISLEEAQAVKDRTAESVMRAIRKPTLEQAQELGAIRELLEGQAHLIEQQRKILQDQTAEIRDLRGQLYQVQQEIIKALPAPQPPKKPRWKLW